MGYHVVSINKTLPINNKTHKKVILHSLISILPFIFFSMLLVLITILFVYTAL